MFLKLLNNEQKKLFLSLAYDLAIADGCFSKDEVEVMNSYADEMKVEFVLEDVEKDLVRVIDKMNDVCSHQEKKIVIFEIIGLAMADSKYDEAERKIVNHAMTVFNLDMEYGTYCEDKISQYLVLQEELSKRILSE